MVGAFGAVAGSACLGMLIPPSILLIVWAILTEMSVGALFIAGLLPGLLLALLFAGYVVISAARNPEIAPWIIGDQDSGVSPETMRAMADATPGAQFKEIENAAHIANIDNPLAFNAALDGFLQPA